MPDAEARVWLLDLPEVLAANDESALTALLAPAERVRAAQFHQPIDRLRFVARRAGLRQILGACLREDPARLEFAAREQGKPYLAGAHRGALHFNASASGAIACVAVSRDEDIGVDIERRRAIADAPALAARYFSAAEQDAVRVANATAVAADPSARQSAFLIVWTRKEAFLKHCGLGLVDDLPNVHVGLPQWGVALRADYGGASGSVSGAYLTSFTASQHGAIVSLATVNPHLRIRFATHGRVSDTLDRVP